MWKSCRRGSIGPLVRYVPRSRAFYYGSTEFESGFDIRAECHEISSVKFEIFHSGLAEDSVHV